MIVSGVVVGLIVLVSVVVVEIVVVVCSLIFGIVVTIVIVVEKQHCLLRVEMDSFGERISFVGWFAMKCQLPSLPALLHLKQFVALSHYS